MDGLLNMLAKHQLKDRHLRDFAQSMRGYHHRECGSLSSSSDPSSSVSSSKQSLVSDQHSSDEEDQRLAEFVSQATLVCTFESIPCLEPKSRVDLAVYDTHLALLPHAKAKKGGVECWRKEAMIIKWQSMVTCVSVFSDNMQAYFYLALSEPCCVRFRKQRPRVTYVLLRFDDESGIADPFEVTVQSTVKGKVPSVVSAPTTVQALCQVVRALVPRSVVCLQSDPELFVLPKECLKTVGGGHTSGEPVLCLPVFSGASDVKMFPLRAGLFFVGPKKLTGLLNIGDITHVSYPRGVDDSMRYYEMLIHTSLRRVCKNGSSVSSEKSVSYSLNMIPSAAHRALESALRTLGICIGEPKKQSTVVSSDSNSASSSSLSSSSTSSSSSNNTRSDGDSPMNSDENKNDEMMDDYDSEQDSDYDPSKEEDQSDEEYVSDSHYSDNDGGDSDDQKTSSIDKECSRE